MRRAAAAVVALFIATCLSDVSRLPVPQAETQITAPSDPNDDLAGLFNGTRTHLPCLDDIAAQIADSAAVDGDLDPGTDAFHACVPNATAAAVLSATFHAPDLAAVHRTWRNSPDTAKHLTDSALAAFGTAVLYEGTDWWFIAVLTTAP